MTPRRSLLEGTTPGPWKVSSDWALGVRGRPGQIAITSVSEIVDGVAVTALGWSQKKAEANARLIAAAPTLAEENEELREILADVLTDGAEHMRNIERWGKRAEALLAKGER